MAVTCSSSPRHLTPWHWTLLSLTVKALDGLGATRYRILLSIIPPRPSRDADEARSTLTEAGQPLLTRGIRRLVTFQKAALAEVPVYAVDDPRAKLGWEDYQEVGKEILP
jgi:chromosome partitioning protein